MLEITTTTHVATTIATNKKKREKILKSYILFSLLFLINILKLLMFSPLFNLCYIKHQCFSNIRNAKIN